MCGSGLGLGNIKLESPSYFSFSSSAPSTEHSSSISSVAQLISTNYGTLSLAPARVSTPPNTVSVDGAGVIRVKRMRRMSSDTDEPDKSSSGHSGHVSELQYYSAGSPAWTQGDITDHASAGLGLEVREVQSNESQHNTPTNMSLTHADQEGISEMEFYTVSSNFIFQAFQPAAQVSTLDHQRVIPQSSIMRV